MRKNRWLLPEGIEEALPEQAAHIESLRRRLLDLYATWGYELVVTPFIEYLESLLTGTGNDLDLQTFKVVDHLTGRLMGLRADITPQVARIDAHRLKRDVPTRLCYVGTVLRTRPDVHGGSRSPLQVGIELYGHSGLESDIEVLSLMIETLRSAGLKTLHLDFGHVGIFRALAAAAELDEESEAELFDALQRMAKPELTQLLDDARVDAPLAKMFMALADLNGGDEALAEARKQLQGAPEEVGEALSELERIAEFVAGYDDVSINFDLAELRGYHYHTGVVFAAFVPGKGQAIAQGGRYDDIGRVFGRARPATGFSTDLKGLLAITGAPRQPVRGIFAPADSGAQLLQTIAQLRSEGERVVQALPGQSGDAKAMGCDRALVEKDGTWQIESIN